MVLFVSDVGVFLFTALSGESAWYKNDLEAPSENMKTGKRHVNNTFYATEASVH